MTDDSHRRAELLDKLKKLKSQVESLRQGPEKDVQASVGVEVDLRALDSLISALPDPLFFKDTRSRYILVNRAYATLMGIEQPKYAYGKTDFDFFDREFAHRVYLGEQELLQTAQPDLNREEIIIRRDGTQLRVSVSRVPVRSQTGELAGVVGIIRTGGEQLSAGQAERETDANLHRLLAASSDIISVLDANGTILYETPSSHRILGHDRTYPRLGMSFFGLCHPADLKRLMELYNALIRHPGTAKKITYGLRHADGSWVLLESIFRNLLDDPAVRGIMVNSRDVTEDQHAKEKATIFEHVIKSVNDCITISDLQNNIIFVNQAFCDTYGYAPEEIIGKHTGILWSPKNPGEKLENIFPETLRGGWVGELLHVRIDGSELLVYLTTSVIRDEVGNPIALTGVTRDITKQKQVEEQLRHSQKMESLGVLVGGIAHNFNNILGVIMGYASLLEEGESDRDKLIRNARVITEAAERGAHLVHQLMTYIKKSPVRFEVVPVNKVIEEMTDMSKQTFPQTVTFIHRLDRRNPTILADHNQFNQVLFNLYLNARDAMPEGGSITVSSEVVHGDRLREKFLKVADSDYVCLTVTDTGFGMDDEIQSRIFDPFFTTKEIGKGVGLGLPMVYGMVESHNGFIEVESETDRGSIFRLYFQLKDFSGTEDQSDTSEHPRRANGSETILVVEDEEPIRELVTRALSDYGYRVLTAGDGLEAIKIFGESHKEIDLVVMDLGLPRMSGYDVITRMRELDPGVRVVVASGYNDPDSKAQLERAGVKYFVQKPYKSGTILKIVRQVLDIES